MTDHENKGSPQVPETLARVLAEYDETGHTHNETSIGLDYGGTDNDHCLAEAVAKYRRKIVDAFSAELAARDARIAELEHETDETRRPPKPAYERGRDEERAAVLARLRQVVNDHAPYVAATKCNQAIMDTVSDLLLAIERGDHAQQSSEGE